MVRPTPPRPRPTRPATAQDHWQRLEVETPEHVVRDYEIAGFGSRLLAALADGAILIVVFVVLFFLVGGLAGGTTWGQLVVVLAGFALLWGYFAGFEGFFRGQTPGKRWLGLRVVRDNGQPIGVPEAAIRNLLRVADYLPPPFLLGLALIAFHSKAKRLGDLVAGTVVVRDRPIETAPAEPATPGEARSEPSGDGTPRLDDDQYRVLGGFLDRAAALEPAVRDRFADRLTARFAAWIPAGAGGEMALRDLYVVETARRQSRFGGGGGSAAVRFVARKQARWDEFQHLATRAADQGLDGFAPAELLDFTTRYREVAADYARARTYRVPAAAQVRLERAVASGHNALYRETGATWARLWRFVSVECPAAVVRSSRAVGLAFLAFTVPALLGYGLLRERPEVAPQVLPDVMLERAEAGAARQREGKGYFDADPGQRPLVAASIIANNVQVAFLCFAGGVFAGVGSLILLAQNGLSIGAASGHFANAGLFGYLWTFVAGHGLLELFAIWVAGAAGFQLGFAILSPGRLSRRDALVLAGQRAI